MRKVKTASIALACLVFASALAGSAAEACATEDDIPFQAS